MLRRGATQAEVAEHYHVTQAAVSLAIQRGNINMSYDRVGGRRHDPMVTDQA